MNGWVHRREGAAMKLVDGQLGDEVAFWVFGVRGRIRGCRFWVEDTVDESRGSGSALAGFRS
jgi:hypothetical protein